MKKVQDHYDIQFPLNGAKNFVENIGDASFKDKHQLQLRHGMAREAGTVWYDRVPKRDKLITLFGNAVTTQTSMEV